jgi:hypothetical protein
MKNNALITLFTIALLSGVSSASLVRSAQKNDSLISQSDKSREIDISKISIGRLKLRMNVKEVKKILGQPSQRQQIKDMCLENATKLKYNKLEITLYNPPNPSDIFSISTSNPSYSTSEGIRVGDSIGKAKRAYAKYKSTLNGQNLVYPANMGESSLLFKVDKGLITEIILDAGC